MARVKKTITKFRKKVATARREVRNERRDRLRKVATAALRAVENVLGTAKDRIQNMRLELSNAAVDSRRMQPRRRRTRAPHAGSIGATPLPAPTDG